MKLMKTLDRMVGKIVNSVTNTVSQTSVASGEICKSSEEISRLCRQLSAEGIVMLKNDNNVLPLSKDRVVSVFGRVQKDYFYVGYGSGGDVNAPYKINLIDGLRACNDITVNEELAAVYENWIKENPVYDGYWGHWPMCYDEMPVTSTLVKSAAEKSDTAIIVFGRAAGEDRENTLTEGSYYLTKTEKELLDTVCRNFEKVVVLLDCGSIIDMSWAKIYDKKISSLLYVWQGGMESGNAIAEVLSGKVSPSGKLADTIAKKYSDYPSANFFGNKEYNEYTEDIYVGYRFFETFAKDKVLYPFGFGKSYAEFDVKTTTTRINGDIVNIFVTVKNISEKYSGKETVQVYVNAPQGQLGKPLRSLATFQKTKMLAPGEEEKIKLTFKISDCASYDDIGITGHKSAYVLEKGSYEIYVGTDVRSATAVRTFDIPTLKVVAQLTQAAAPSPAHPFERLIAKTDESGNIKAVTMPAPTMQISLKKRIKDNLPQSIAQTGDVGYKLADVKSGRITMQEFVAQLSFDELEAITRGDYVMNSPLGAAGNAGAFGGVLESLREKGVPALITTDGPSGIRLAACCSLLPNGAVLACSFNKELIIRLYAELAKEMKDRGSDILLAPGMNIHRNPLCGRNFEYFSEDPLVSGITASGVVEGIQSQGVSACPKHFACNNQEVNRTHNDSRVSERALREIYLKGFEIVVKTAKPKNIMTSYNKINGVWGHYNYDLCTTILRGEWGYKGNVMTDWWMRSSESPEFKGTKDQAYRVRAQVDVLMPGGKRTGARKPDGSMKSSFGKKDGITLGELQRSAMNVLSFALEMIEN
ncbi:MAG: glycoside hydrolase family 3 C-terminal domain-containing protein [Faecalibacterium sp.]|nr:glycoside hydrolase family 3 C-terminal domain-containing protein [Ruminococcus sp.]MCM1392905.1 glycoside hydrolase family 3 C-terminal domain-containing protein [Ruminococcus sp.]MCM1485313.1 glycoside hydrolase family 3 C-terminal domain-containing protein [Faecalibacterium sp.]